MNTSCTHPTRYATDLTDAEWDVVAPYVNADPVIGSPRTVCMRCVVNALILYRQNRLPVADAAQ